MAGREVRERHLIGPADPGVDMVDLAGESMRRQPFHHGVGIEKGPIDPFRRRTKDTMESDGVCGHGQEPPSFWDVQLFEPLCHFDDYAGYRATTSSHAAKRSAWNELLEHLSAY